MKYLIAKDIKYRRLYKNFESKALFVNALKGNQRLSFFLRLSSFDKLMRYKAKFSSSLHIRNRCVVTGRSRSVYRFFSLTRMQIRLKASFGNFQGVKKSSW